MVDASLVELSSKQPCGGGYFSHLVGVSGIYQIVNCINGKSYVGQSNNLSRRFREHRSKRDSSCKTISRAFKKYGRHNFKFVLLEICGVETLSDREIFWIAKLKPEYNRTAGGDGCAAHSISEKTRRKLSMSGKAQWASKTDEEKASVISRFIRPAKGHPVSCETRRKIRRALLGRRSSRVLTLDSIARISRSTTASNRRVKKRSNPVVQIHPRWGTMNYFPSFQVAAQETGVSAWSIGQVIAGKRGRKTAGGFYWKDFKINAGTKYDPQKHEH